MDLFTVVFACSREFHISPTYPWCCREACRDLDNRNRLARSLPDSLLPCKETTPSSPISLTKKHAGTSVQFLESLPLPLPSSDQKPVMSWMIMYFRYTGDPNVICLFWHNCLSSCVTLTTWVQIHTCSNNLPSNPGHCTVPKIPFIFTSFAGFWYPAKKTFVFH